MRAILLLLSFNCFSDEILEHIQKNKPDINDKYAVKIAKQIKKYSNLHDIDYKIISAIMMQESSYDHTAKQCRKGYTDDNKLKKVCLDFGIMQVNHVNIRKFELDLVKITTDLDYSIKAGMTLLVYTKKLHGKKKNWWLYYHSYNKELQNIYRKKVERWL